jgi:hypothetical protein
MAESKSPLSFSTWRKIAMATWRPRKDPMIWALTIGLDHRFIDGYQAATMARVFRQYLGDPAAFDPVPISTGARGRRSATALARPASKPSSSGPVRPSARPLDGERAKR